MKSYEIEAYLKSNYQSFNKIENNFAEVDGLYIDYNLSSPGKQASTFNRLLSSDNIIVLSEAMDRDNISELLSKIKSERIYNDFSLVKEGYKYFAVANGHKVSEITISMKNNEFFFDEKIIDECIRLNKPVLASKILSLADLDSINYISNIMYKENYYNEFLNKEHLSYLVAAGSDIIFNNIIFTFNKLDFEKVG